MNFMDNFDNIIDLIEENIETDFSEVNDILAKKLGYSTRVINEIFSFITGNNLKAYYYERKMVYALVLLKRHTNVSCLDVAEKLGYEEQASFTNAFKKRFGVSPKEAQRTNISIPCVRYLKDYIDEVESLRKYNGIKSEEPLIFGIPKSEFEKIKKAVELAGEYGLTSEETGLAYDFYIFKAKKLTIDENFKFISDYIEACSFGSAENLLKYPQGLEDINMYFFDMYSHYGKMPTESISFISEFLRFHPNGKIENIPQKIIDLHYIVNYNYYQAERIYEMVKDDDRINADWNDFLDWLIEANIPYDSVLECYMFDFISEEELDCALDNDMDFNEDFDLL